MLSALVVPDLERRKTNLVECHIRPVPREEQLGKMNTVARSIDAGCWADAVPWSVRPAVNSWKLISNPDFRAFPITTYQQSGSKKVSQSGWYS